MYKIVKNKMGSMEVEVLLETDNIEEVIKFYSTDFFDLRIMTFDDLMHDFVELIEGNGIYDVSLIDYVNECVASIGSVNATIDDLEKMSNNKMVIVVGADERSTDTRATICENNEKGIAYAISEVNEFVGEVSTSKGIRPTYELITEN